MQGIYDQISQINIRRRRREMSTFLDKNGEWDFWGSLFWVDTTQDICLEISILCLEFENMWPRSPRKDRVNM